MKLFSKTNGWLIATGEWEMRLGECAKEHALSVLEQIEKDPTLPKNLTLKRIKL